MQALGTAAGDVEERHAEEDVGAALVELGVELARACDAGHW